MKKKMLVVIGIAVCAILLTAPALASAGYSKIYGNANEDDTLDMRDVSYIKLAILGEKPATTLADANYDGKVSMQDVAQTKLIILDKEKELTLVDTADRIVTVPRPLERVITNCPDLTRLAIALGADDGIVGAGRFGSSSSLCPCRSETTAAGKRVCVEGCMNCVHTILDGRVPDMTETRTRYIRYYEVMASLHPDIIIVESITYAEDYEDKIDCPCVVVGGTGSTYSSEDGLYGQIEAMGTLLEREDEADELIDFIESKLDMVRSVTETLDESEKPTVYFASRGCHKGFYDPKEGRDFTRTMAFYEPLNIAGGINVAEDMQGSNIGIEQLIAWEPDYIFVGCSSPDRVDAIDFVLTCDELQTIPAVYNGNVYNCFYPHSAGRPADRNLFNVIYMAKVLHPEEFADLDLEKEGNEIFEAFLRVDGVFTEYADYIVWPREYLDEQQ